MHFLTALLVVILTSSASFASSVNLEQTTNARIERNLPKHLHRIEHSTTIEDIRHNIMLQIYPCWSIPSISKDKNLIVPLQIQYNQQGIPIKVELAPDAKESYLYDEYFQATADSAIRAVRRCAPLQMPPNIFNIWQYINMNFVPSKLH